MQDQFEQSTLETLAWFDLFDHPLTPEELQRYAWGSREVVESKNMHSFYTLPGRKKIIETRQRKVAIIEKKLKIVRRAAKKLRWIPFVQAVFVSNTVAAGTADTESDIDVFIVVKSGRLWLTRLLVTLSLSVFRLRRTKRCVANRVCLCFYTTDNHLNLETIAIEQPDIYLAYWITQLMPIYDPNNVRQKIMKENSWVKKYIPNGLKAFTMLSRYRVDDGRVSLVFKRFFEKVWTGSYGNLLEQQAKGVQEAKMKTNLHSVQQEKDSRVIINDAMMKFHENDRREDYKRQWRERYQTYAQN